ncbi:MAG: FHA domain-containing protein [Sedimentisphaerales bacterium]|nr:FHA domain-containing protein [Sedimentisphaerales bacterium]
MACLKGIAGSCRDSRFELSNARRLVTVGRENADILLNDPSVSRLHAEFLFRDGQWLLQDLRSSNGTLVNGRCLERPIQLRHNDQIQFGLTVLTFESDQGSIPGEQDAQSIPEGVPVGSPEDTIVDLDFETLLAKKEESPGLSMSSVCLSDAGRRALDLSHGIKNILQAIKGGREVLDLALKKQDMIVAQRSWSILCRNLDLVQKLVLDLLQFSRQYNPVFVRCDFNRIVRTAVETLRSQARKEAKELLLDLDESIPSVQMDPDQMYDVILNLTLNAIQAVAPKTGCVRIQTRSDTESDRVLLTVADNGMGIEDTVSIFEPFFTTRAKGGVGLGLSIVKKIVTQHSGSIQVASTPGQGSVFTVLLPLNPALALSAPH